MGDIKIDWEDNNTKNDAVKEMVDRAGNLYHFLLMYSEK